MKGILLFLTRNRGSLLGTALTTASAVLIITLIVLEALGGIESSPYMGIIVFLILPAFFVLGLLLIPLGHWEQRRREARAARGGSAIQPFPVFDLNQGNMRRGALIFLAATLVNLVILGAASYKGVEVSDSTPFCGRTCHTVMQPEYTAWQRSPHSRVGCVSCHIGPGASWFVKSKLSGTWQVFAVTFNLYPRPIPTPVQNLRPARETCEQCHWPTKFVGDRLKVITHYADDEASTPKKTVLVVRVGGAQGSRSHGIHWHVDPGVAIRYKSDEKRERIEEVELTRDGAQKVLYKAPVPASSDGKPVAPATTWRTMDCVDCHNRPTHVYQPPDNAIDTAMFNNQIDRGLPFVHREGLRLIQQTYGSQEEARVKIAEGLRAFYEKNDPDVLRSRRDAVDAAGKALGDAYCTNVFPTMNVQWGTYPNHIGHQGSPGCFRCHDDEHKSADGRTISQDCGTCHSLLAQDEENPDILRQLNP